MFLVGSSLGAPVVTIAGAIDARPRPRARYLDRSARASALRRADRSRPLLLVNGSDDAMIPRRNVLALGVLIQRLAGLVAEWLAQRVAVSPARAIRSPVISVSAGGCGTFRPVSMSIPRMPGRSATASQSSSTTGTPPTASTSVGRGIQG